MSWTENHTTVIFGDDVELELTVNPAEHDVGIMGNWIEDWEIISVNGSTDKEVINEMVARIEEEFGDEKFIERLYDEGCAEDPEYDFYD
jgi:hypothetical protein